MGLHDEPVLLASTAAMSPGSQDKGRANEASHGSKAEKSAPKEANVPRGRRGEEEPYVVSQHPEDGKVRDPLDSRMTAVARKYLPHAEAAHA